MNRVRQVNSSLWREQDVSLPYFFPGLPVGLIRCEPLSHELGAQGRHFVLRLLFRFHEQLVQLSFRLQLVHHPRSELAPVFFGHPAVLS